MLAIAGRLVLPNQFGLSKMGPLARDMLHFVVYSDKLVISQIIKLKRVQHHCLYH